MFYLHTSNKTEHLLRHLTTLIEVDPQKNIFEKEYILIQSQGMERVISQHMASAFTSWCNFEFMLPLAFLQAIAEKLDMEIMVDSFDRSALCWRIEAKLQQIDDDYGALNQYLTGKNIAQKRYQLARQLANIFDQYQLMRPWMLEGWEKGRLSTEDPSEIWQMRLWQRLKAEDVTGHHRGELLQKVITRLSEEDLGDFLPRRVAIFGLNIMPPLFLDYLNALSKQCDIHLFLLSPCQHYWGDMGDRREILKKRVEQRERGLHVDEKIEESHPLLTSLGVQGRVFQELLLENVIFEREITSYEDPFNHDKPKLLHWLQSTLLAGVLPTGNSDFKDDTSIRIVSCHSKQRELAVLKDHILNLLYSDMTLQLRDIVVMAPDIQEYAPFIPAVFEDIQHSIADRSLQQRNVYISTFAEFLTLLSGRFGWEEVLALLQKKQIFPNFFLTFADLERLQHWIIATGIRWGLSREMRKSAGFDFSENSWRDGLERLLMGYMIDTEQPIEGVLPYNDIEGGEAKILGGLCEFIRLIERAARIVCQSKELPEWSTLLLDFAESLFGTGDDRDLLELRAILRELGDYGSFHHRKIEFEVIPKWFENSFSEVRSASGFLRGYLTFCSMLPMRSIPFRALCMIGMNHTVFPKTDRNITFDLMSRYPRPGDRSLRADDRYQFLEALLSARESLYISYLGQSLQNNEEIPPSVVVTELQESLKNCCISDDIVVNHPLHPFSNKYFSDPGGPLFSYSAENYQIAVNLNKIKKKSGDWWAGNIEVEIENIDLADLLSFYRNPQHYFVERCLGVSLVEDSFLPEERETFKVEGLDSFLINQRIVEKLLQGEDLEDFHQQLSVEGRWPLGSPGDLIFSLHCEELRRFALTVEAQAMGQKQADIEIDLQVGKYRLQGKLSNIYEGGLLLYKYLDVKGKDLLGAWIHHLVGVACSKASICGLVMKDCSIIFNEQNTLQPGLEELIDHFVEGCSTPSKLYIEPALQYCRQKLSKKGRVSPLIKAQTTLHTSIEKGYEPAWLLLNNSETLLLDEGFESLCQQLMMPLWSVCNDG